MNTRPPLLSVIVPFHDVEAYLAFLLDSLRSQSCTDAEFILVADEPADGSLEIARSYAQADSRFIVMETPRGGPGPAKNLGVSNSRGTFLTFVDGDDAVTTHGLDIAVRTLQRTGSSFATSNAWRFDDDMRVWQSWTHRHAFTRDRLRTHLVASPDLAGDRMTTSKVFRRDFWEGAGLRFPARLYEDLPVAIRAHAAADSVDVLKDHLYLWRKRRSNNSITQLIHDGQNAIARATSSLEVLDVASANAPTVLRPVAERIREIDVPALEAVAEHALTSQLLELTSALTTRLAAILDDESGPDESSHEPASNEELPAAAADFDEATGTLRVSMDEGTWCLESLALLDPSGSVQVQVPLKADHQSRLDPGTLLADVEGPRTLLRALGCREGSVAIEVLNIKARSLPTVSSLGEQHVAWGVYAAGTLEATHVSPEQTARFALEADSLIVDFDDPLLEGVVELRKSSSSPASRERLLHGRAHFDVAELVALATPDDPIRRETRWLILLDQAGDCRQLHPITLEGETSVNGIGIAFSRSYQGATQLLFTWY